jgi:hypothetical protein
LLAKCVSSACGFDTRAPRFDERQNSIWNDRNIGEVFAELLGLIVSQIDHRSTGNGLRIGHTSEDGGTFREPGPNFSLDGVLFEDLNDLAGLFSSPVEGQMTIEKRDRGRNAVFKPDLRTDNELSHDTSLGLAMQSATKRSAGNAT